MLRYHNISDAVYYMERVIEIDGAQLKICADESIIGDVTLLSSEGDCFLEVDGHRQHLSNTMPIILHPWSLYHYSGVGVLRTRYLVLEGTNLERALEAFFRTGDKIARGTLNTILENILQSPRTIKVQNRPVDTQSSKSMQKLDVAEHLKTLIDENYLSGPQLSCLQQRKGFHPTVSGRLFKDRFGTTPKQYLQRLQVLKSLQNIIRTNDPLSHTAFDAGFQDVSRFYKSFNKIIGTSPGKVRKFGGWIKVFYFQKKAFSVS